MHIYKRRRENGISRFSQKKFFFGVSSQNSQKRRKTLFLNVSLSLAARSRKCNFTRWLPPRRKKRERFFRRHASDRFSQTERDTDFSCTLTCTDDVQYSRSVRGIGGGGMEVWIFSSSGCSIGKQHNGVLVLMKRKGRIRQTVKVYNCHFPQVFLAIGECQCLRSIPESSSCEWQRAETERENGGRKRKKRKCAPGENDVCSVQSLHHFHLTWPPIRPSMHIV